MIRGLFGPTSTPAMLRGGLEETMKTHRQVAARVSGALSSSSAVDPSDPNAVAAAAAGGGTGDVDLQAEMSALADTQLRYEADAKLLQAAYARLRSAVTARG